MLYFRTPHVYVRVRVRVRVHRCNYVTLVEVAILVYTCHRRVYASQNGLHDPDCTVSRDTRMHYAPCTHACTHTRTHEHTHTHTHQRGRACAGVRIQEIVRHSCTGQRKCQQELDGHVMLKRGTGVSYTLVDT